MPNIGLTELLLILGVAVLLFGSRLPSIGKSLGSGIRDFKKGLSGEDTKEEPGQSGAREPAGPREHGAHEGLPSSYTATATATATTTTAAAAPAATGASGTSEESANQTSFGTKS